LLRTLLLVRSTTLTKQFYTIRRPSCQPSCGTLADKGSGVEAHSVVNGEHRVAEELRPP